MSELADLSTNVAVLLVKFNAMEATNISDHKHIADTLALHGQQLQKVDQAIRGNARRGLKARMEAVEHFVGGLTWFKRIVIVAAVGAFLSMVAAIFINLSVTMHKEHHHVEQETQAERVADVDGRRDVSAGAVGGGAGVP